MPSGCSLYIKSIWSIKKKSPAPPTQRKERKEMTADELYTALKEIEQTTDTAERDDLLQAPVKRLVEYPNAD